MKHSALSWLLLLLALVAVPGFGQLPKLDALLKDLEEKSQFYGSVLVRKGGTVVDQGAYGLRDRAAEARNTLESIYYLAECSELFSGTLTMMAVDKGLLSLDEPIATYVPAFQGKPAPPLRSLLSHTSGLGARIYFTGEKARTKATRAAMAAEDGLYFKPGARFDFTGINADLLGMALERATGKPYATLLSEWIITPLKLKQTGFYFLPQENPNLATIPGMPELYALMRLGVDGLPGLDAYATVGDLSVFLEALAAGRLVSKESLDLMRTGVLEDTKFTRGKGKVGLGLFIAPSGAIFHQGRQGVSSLNGYHTLAYFDPRYDLTITLLSNLWKPRPDATALDLVVPVVYADLGLTP